jgi:hypothetical protein
MTGALTSDLSDETGSGLRHPIPNERSPADRRTQGRGSFAAPLRELHYSQCIEVAVPYEGWALRHLVPSLFRIGPLNLFAATQILIRLVDPVCARRIEYIKIYSIL